MALNDKPCGTCQNFDPVLRGTNKGHRPTIWGWCAKRSVYPYAEGPGQKFPAGVRQVQSPEMRAEPFMVKVVEVQGNCTDHAPRMPGLSKADLLKKINEQNSKRGVNPNG